MLPLDIVIWRLWRRAEENAIAALINRRSFVCVLASSVTGDDGGGEEAPERLEALAQATGLQESLLADEETLHEEETHSGIH